MTHLNNKTNYSPLKDIWLEKDTISCKYIDMLPCHPAIIINEQSLYLITFINGWTIYMYIKFTLTNGLPFSQRCGMSGAGPQDPEDFSGVSYCVPMQVLCLAGMCMRRQFSWQLFHSGKCFAVYLKISESVLRTDISVLKVSNCAEFVWFQYFCISCLW